MTPDKTENISLIRGISIPIHGYPLISEGSYKDMIKTYFLDKEVVHAILNKNDYIIMSPYYFNNYSYVNYLATALYRSFKPSEQSSQDFVYGPVLIVGKEQFLEDYISVSQQTTESVLNIFTRDLYEIKHLPQ